MLDGLFAKKIMSNVLKKQNYQISLICFSFIKNILKLNENLPNALIDKRS